MEHKQKILYKKLRFLNVVPTCWNFHGLLHQEDGTLSLSRRVKACRVGQIHGEMF